MINLNNYIIEKLHLNKDIDIHGKPSIENLEDELKNLFEEFKQSLPSKLIRFRIELDEGRNSFNIYINEEARLYLKQMCDFIHIQLDDRYKIETSYSLSSSKIIVDYED